jgi:hypothetical protein
VALILHIDDTPAVLTPTDRLAVHDDSLLTSNNGKRNDVLISLDRDTSIRRQGNSYLNAGIYSTFLIVKLIIVVRVHLEVVEGKLLLNSLLERLAFFEGERIGFGDHRHDIDNVGQLLQNDDINRFQTFQKQISN